MARDAAPQPILHYRARCPKAAVAAHTLPHQRSPPKHGQPSLSPRLWLWHRLSGTLSTALAQSCSSFLDSMRHARITALACTSSQAPCLGGMPEEAHWPFPITGFTQQVPCATSHIPPFWTEAYILSQSTCTDPALAEEMEGAQVKPRPSQPQHPAHS